MFGISSWEMAVVFIIALLLFGKRLPEVARSLGKGMMEFKKGLHGFEDEIQSAARTPVTSQSRPLPREERDEAVAPKFEPPKFEPTDTTEQQSA
ncbi:MAG: Sec-independent protein translocase subunit TatA/TatB [Planctomycetaceae bacterium]